MISEAIAELAPGAEWSLVDEDLSTLQWFSENIGRPSNEQIEAKAAELQAKFEETEYQRLRAPEYPPIGDQLDDLYHLGVFSQEMAAKIQAVKEKYPKPE